MHTGTERTTFIAYDANGTAYTVIAERVVRFVFGSLPDKGPWTFRTDDGRGVQFNSVNRHYIVPDSGEVLKSTDPRQPNVCGGSV